MTEHRITEVNYQLITQMKELTSIELPPLPSISVVV